MELRSSIQSLVLHWRFLLVSVADDKLEQSGDEQALLCCFCLMSMSLLVTPQPFHSCGFDDSYHGFCHMVNVAHAWRFLCCESGYQSRRTGQSSKVFKERNPIEFLNLIVYEYVLRSNYGIFSVTLVITSSRGHRKSAPTQPLCLPLRCDFFLLPMTFTMKWFIHRGLIIRVWSVLSDLAVSKLGTRISSLYLRHYPNANI